MDLCEVLDREQLTSLFDHAHADGIHIAVQNICAMTGGAHELGVDGLRGRALRYVFRKPCEMYAGLFHANLQTRFTVESVLRRPVIRHHRRVTAGASAGKPPMSRDCRRCSRA